MRVALFGGSFNPPHSGHRLVAEWAVDALGLDRVIWIPAHRSPFKTGVDLASADDRLRMVMRATAGNKRFEVSDIELHRKPPSYTVDTVAAMSGRFPEAQLLILIGEDSFAEFARWRDPERILSMASLVVYPRGCEQPTASDLPHTILAAPRIEISSRVIRTRVGEGRSIRYLVPDGVHTLIEARGLYRSDRT